MTEDQMEQIEKLCNAYRKGDKAEVDVKLEKLRVEIKHNKELFDVQEKASDKALALARDMLREKLAEENHIREQLTAQALTFLTIKEYEGRHDALETKLDVIADKASTLSGKMVIIVIAIPMVMSLIISILAAFLTHVLMK